MAIILNDNIKINAGKPSESKYLSSSNAPYTSISAARTAIPISERYLGLTVLIDTGSTNIEYWWKEGVQDVDLIEKKFASEQFVGDFITGATNLGFFSGTTAIQMLTMAGASFTSTLRGDYFSEYQWYYLDNNNIIRIGRPTSNAPLRRGYVKAARDRSWVYSFNSNKWVFITNDVATSVGDEGVVITSSPIFTNEEWIDGQTYVATNTNFAIITVTGSLTTGNTLTIGNSIYKDKSDQNLHLRTIINDSPDVLNIEADDYYIRFSGATSILNAENVGAGDEVFKQKTGTTLQFRTLVGSGDTQISSVGDNIVIFAGISGQTSITGGTNIGFTGGTGVFAGNDNKTMQFRNIVGSGDTTVNQSGDTIVVHTIGGEVFNEDLVVSIAVGKTFGKYENGDTIPASGKTPSDVIRMAILEALPPTISLSSSGNDVAFGESGKTVNLNFSYTINTAGANVASTVLEWRRGGVGSWSGFTITTGSTTYVHNIDDSGNRFNTDVLNYRYTVVDTAGASGQTTHNVTPQAYTAPSMSITLGGTAPSPQTQTSREKGNVISNPSGSIAKTSSLVNITAWTLQRRYNGGSYIVLASGTTEGSIPATLDNTIPTSATSIDYRITYVDEYTSGAGGTQTITFFYYSYYGFNTNIVLNSAQIIALVNKAKLSNQNLTWNNIGSPSGNYTYYSYPSTYNDFSSVIKNGVLQDFGAWQKLSNVDVTNTYGELLAYKVWRTNATQAYGATDDIVIS